MASKKNNLQNSELDLKNLEQYDLAELFDLTDEIEADEEVNLSEEEERENETLLEELFGELNGEV